MTERDSNDSEGGEAQQQEVVNHHEVEGGQGDPGAGTEGLGGEPEPQEEERTLTDHLNKKLLQSFLDRLESGNMQFPPQAQPAVEQEEDWEND